ncbi:hypothetical protein KDU71_21295 [Carboxylicivirga sediminis]|uniref:Uncharacterized protein n=1 Tax=Carboxylicivirga sediminis TaxID=2006564 RepID=A0A941FBB9_9BACT|nr:hypothetical protein [Carboxylicivirga sediminis]MBR8538120.1 hypothetical protein [Carboxylicivirga sediminis]
MTLFTLLNDALFLCLYSLFSEFAHRKIPILQGVLYREKLNGVTKMKSNELESQIKSVKKTKVLLYLILALVVALILIVFVV